MKLDLMILNEMNVKLLKIVFAVEREEEVNLANTKNNVSALNLVF